MVSSKYLKLIEKSGEIAEAPTLEPSELFYSARQFVQATLPHRQPRDNPPEWSRTNGNYTLAIRPGYKRDPVTKERVCVGYPFGNIPRLLLFWLTTEVVRTKERKLYLGSSLTDFMKEIGLNPSNGSLGAKRSDARRLNEQMERLFRATISFDYLTPESDGWLNMTIADAGEFWWSPKDPSQIELFESWIELGEKFHRAILAAPIPVDPRALYELRQSPLALDLYVWLAYRMHRVSLKDKPALIPWGELQKQLGCDFGRTRDFSRQVREVLQRIQALYPSLDVRPNRRGIQLYPSPSLVTPRLIK